MKIYSVQLERGDDVLFATQEQADEYARLSGNGPVSERTIPTVADGEALLDEYRDADEDALIDALIAGDSDELERLL